MYAVMLLLWLAGRPRRQEEVKVLERRALFPRASIFDVRHVAERGVGGSEKQPTALWSSYDAAVKRQDGNLRHTKLNTRPECFFSQAFIYPEG